MELEHVPVGILDLLCADERVRWTAHFPLVCWDSVAATVFEMCNSAADCRVRARVTAAIPGDTFFDLED